MLNYLKKFAVDIFPSVAATVIGAYIVNHYIVAKPGADAPPAGAASTANPKGDGGAEARTEAKAASDAKPAETAASVSNLPAAGVKARGISEKAIMEKTAAERPAVVEKPQEKSQEKSEAKAEAKADAKADIKADAKVDAKSSETPAETASAPAEPRRQQAAPREKEKIRVVLPSPVQPAASSAAPVVAAAPTAPVETAPEEHRDANDLARAAIERLRANGEGAPRAPETARAPDVPKEASKEVTREASKTDPSRAVTAPAIRPLPPPIMVSAPPTGEPSSQQGSSQSRPPYAANAEPGNPNRPTPPADIPLSRPLDLRAEAAEPSVRERASAAAEDALSTAKSLFQSVLPKP
jgi:hypothetical protein